MTIEELQLKVERLERYLQSAEEVAFLQQRLRMRQGNLLDNCVGADQLQDALDLSVKTITRLRFPATQVPSTDVNTLDDYEEGTWTPSVGGTATYTLQRGSYTKVGRLVSLQMRLIINVIGTGNAGIISGLPFTIDTTVASSAATVPFFNNLTANTVFLGAYVITNTLVITGIGGAAAAACGAFPCMGNGTDIMLSAHYFT